MAEKQEKQENQKTEVNMYTFEQAMKRLEEVVELLEGGDVPLEEALQLYQEGMLLSRHCDVKLSQIEQKIQVLIEEEGKLETKEFHSEEE